MSDLAGEKLFSILESLRDANIAHRLRIIRDDYVCIDVNVPGERWEVEIGRDGEVEIEVLRSDGKILGEEELPQMIAKFAD